MINTRICLTTVVISWIISGCAFESDKLQQVDSYLDSLHLAGKFEGTVVVGNNEGVILQKALGTAVREWDVPIDPETRFDIASLNKSFVAYMIMQLVESGEIQLSDHFTDHLGFDSEFAEDITIHQMLTHTSGLPDYDAISDSLKENRFEAFKRFHFQSSDEYLGFIASLGPVSEPEEQFYYSNFSYHVLSILIEELTGLAFSAALDSMVCQPLGLTSTYSPEDNYKLFSKVALPYDFVDDKYHKSPFIDFSIGRRIFSSAADLYKWGKEMADPRFLTIESKTQILTNHLKAINSQISYGYGWVVFDGQGDYRMGKMDLPGEYFIHGGSTDGYKSILVVYEGGEYIVSLLGNIGNQINELGTAEHILKILTKEK